MGSGDPVFYSQHLSHGEIMAFVVKTGVMSWIYHLTCKRYSKVSNSKTTVYIVSIRQTDTRIHTHTHTDTSLLGSLVPFYLKSIHTNIVSKQWEPGDTTLACTGPSDSLGIWGPPHFFNFLLHLNNIIGMSSNNLINQLRSYILAVKEEYCQNPTPTQL